MSHLWLADRSTAGWAALPLAGEALDLSLDEAGELRVRRSPGSDALRSSGARVLPHGAQGQEAWVLLCTAGARLSVNGLPLPTGIRLFRDRDEVRFAGGERFYFSAEELAAVVPFPASATVCPRCKQAIEPGSPSVRCPACRAWHHQSESLPCWVYAERCFLCDQPTELNSGFRWSPHEI